jgi:hypothetical protein
MKKTLPTDIESAIFHHATLGRTAKKNGNLIEAEQQFLLAWKLLPQPRTDWVMSQSLVRGLIDFYVEIGQSKSALDWLPILANAYDSTNDLSVVTLCAIVYYETGQLDKAYDGFNFMFQQFKTRPFQGLDEKYFNFYNAEKSKRLAAQKR